MKLNQVCGFEDVAEYYEVETNGDKCWVISKNGKELKAGVSNGYMIYGLQLSSGKQKMIKQHRLFAMAFIPNPENKEQVNHIDGCKTNNLLSNLERNTQSENIRHADRTGLRKMPSGESHGCAKLSKSDLQIIFNLRKSGLTLKAIGDQMGVSHAQISKILRGKRRQSETTLIKSQPFFLLTF